MAADFGLTLRHIGLSRNPEAPMRLVDGRRAGPTPFSEPGRVEFSLIETHFSYGLQRTHEKSNALRCRRDGRWPQFRDQPQDVGEQGSRNGDLSHLEGDIAPVADDFRADLDQLLLQA